MPRDHRPKPSPAHGRRRSGARRRRCLSVADDAQPPLTIESRLA